MKNNGKSAEPKTKVSKKEKELEKYLDKKRRQNLRDDLMSQIAAINSSGKRKPTNPVKTVKRKKKEITEEINFYEEKNNEILLEENNHLDQPSNVNDPVIMDNMISNEIFDNILDQENNLHLSNEKSVLIDEHENKDSLKKLTKELILSFKESFLLNRCNNRNPEIQKQRELLDIFYMESEIITTVKFNIVTFIQGNTGCGKTTQIPQFLFENGFSNSGIIGITQPRRISAVSIASRLNMEMNMEVASYHVKFENNLTERTQLKVMTEGILIKEIQSDCLLEKYSVIIIDEVHERTVNTDILIGLLSKIIKMRLKKGNPLRLILMSATVDYNDFNTVLGDFEIIKLTTTGFKVNVFYESKTPENYIEVSFSKIKSILDSEKKTKSIIMTNNEIINDNSASILVFLPSKDDIYSLKSKLELLQKNLTILPLHSNLSKIEQNKVFEKYEDSRKIVLATNIAETSITIDDVVFVIDTGLVKLKLADQNTVMYRVGYISKSSANQRMGRAGRTKPGVCYRIYSGDTYNQLEESNTPQILMEPLDSYVLQLKSLGIMNLFKFPFVTLPGKNAIMDSIESLEDLCAIKEGKVTSMGKEMAQFPIAPRYSKLLLTANNDDIVYLLCILTAILGSRFELKKTDKLKNYFISETSDLIVSLKICIDYIKATNRRKFCTTLGLPYECLEEIRKMSIYFMKIKNRTNFDVVWSREIGIRIIKIICHVFMDQVAVNFGTSFIYKNGDVFISKDSVEINNKFIVFDYIICGKGKCYIKNITGVIETKN